MSKLPWWLKWVCKAWKSVCTATSWVCKGWSAVCKATRSVVDYSNCVIREKICDAYDWVVDTACSAACHAVGIGLQTARHALIVAEKACFVVRKTLGALAKAAEWVAKWVGKIFNIKKAGFSLKLAIG
mmetsp:Transcript_46421/g.71008  ORF Transcript_46421/g.71008 Transcript_46421/m.71008 type:complete len:128 (+) Transcript_46421:185-568(+)